MLAVARKDGTLRPMSLRYLTALLLASATVGGFTNSALAWIGLKGQSPAARLTSLEAHDSLHEREIRDVTELTRMLVTMRCLEPDSVARVIIQQARVPCQRIFQEQGMRP